MIFYFDMSSGDEAERAKLPARRDRQRQYIRKLVNCENWLRGETATPSVGATSGAAAASDDEWRAALDTMPQMIVWQMEQSCRRYHLSLIIWCSVCARLLIISILIAPIAWVVRPSYVLVKPIYN
jgi:hypothetical protein